MSKVRSSMQIDNSCDEIELHSPNCPNYKHCRHCHYHRRHCCFCNCCCCRHLSCCLDWFVHFPHVIVIDISIFFNVKLKRKISTLSHEICSLCKPCHRHHCRRHHRLSQCERCLIVCEHRANNYNQISKRANINSRDSGIFSNSRYENEDVASSNELLHKDSLSILQEKYGSRRRRSKKENQENPTYARHSFC